jgi:hypothetical protein
MANGITAAVAAGVTEGTEWLADLMGEPGLYFVQSTNALIWVFESFPCSRVGVLLSLRGAYTFSPIGLHIKGRLDVEFKGATRLHLGAEAGGSYRNRVGLICTSDYAYFVKCAGEEGRTVNLRNYEFTAEIRGHRGVRFYPDWSLSIEAETGGVVEMFRSPRALPHGWQCARHLAHAAEGLEYRDKLAPVCSM